VPIAWKLAEKERGPGAIDYTKQELWEWLVVNIPANPECLVEARSMGIDTRPMLHWAERALDGEGRIAITRDELKALRLAAGAPRSFGYRKPKEKVSTMTLHTRISEAGTGFSSFGHFLKAVAVETQQPASDRRLVRVPIGSFEGLVRTPGGDFEGDPSAGGFLVPTQFTEELLALAYEEAVVAPLCDRRVTTQKLADVRVPGIDETSRADGSRFGGALSYWSTEGTTVTGSFPRFKQLNFAAKKLIAFAVTTNELLNDAPFLEAHMRKVFSLEIGFKLDLGILFGTGAGEPLGVVGHPATIVVPKDTGQAAATVTWSNIASMWRSLPAPARKRAIWLTNEDMDKQLDGLTQTIGTAGVVPPSAQALYVNAGEGGYACLKGRPVIPIEQAALTGSVGDLILIDPSQYVIIDGGLQSVLSVHVRFVDDEAVWRFVLRVDGQPAWASPITAYNGSGQRSPYVVLAARS
jgi:HK97 family phage major capsid protein